MKKYKQKKILLENGKTVIVDVPAKKSKKNSFEEVARLVSKFPTIKPCD